ncbi:MAG: alpha-2-macroglobulin [Blastocatellia bacterium]|nr:alpha-2-macroglobulin [Blastocatellia bacterium]
MFQIYRRLPRRHPSPRTLKLLAIYLGIAGAAFAFNVYRLSAAATATEPPALSYAQQNAAAKPFFSLTTNRMFGTDERARLSASYQGVSYLDFRVYRVKDPAQFFQQLENPHRVGEEEKDEVDGDYGARPSVLARTRSLKNWIYAGIKDYVRDQLKREHRQTFNQKFRDASAEPRRSPLNVADYARVPLLNPGQLVSSWREKLTPMGDASDQRTVSLGHREPGVYLVEAVNDDLRAYCVAIVTDLTMVLKATNDGEALVYVVDRKTGEPRAGATVLFSEDRKSLAVGQTGRDGIFKASVERKRAAPPAEGAEAGTEDESGGSYLVMARDGDHFAISDLDSFYFSDYEDEGGDSGLTGYIYTDRPVYRPEQKVYFKGILRRRTKDGYELPAEKTVSVTIEDYNNGKLIEQSFPLSARGTFSGELDLPEEAPLGDYQITARVGAATTSHSFSVEEYKKPEYKVTVKGPQAFARVGETVRFSVDARYFFGSPVADADVKYYITRSPYHHYWFGEADGAGDDVDDSELADDVDDDENFSYDSGGSIADEGEGQLDAKGHLTVEFDVPEPDEQDEWDYTYTLEAQVTDAARREMHASAGFTGTRGRFIADAQPERYLYYQGDAARINVRASDYLGHAVAARVTLKFIEQRWEKIEQDNGSGYTYTDYVPRERELSAVEVETNASGQAVYDYAVPSSGYIYIKAILHDNGAEIVNRGGSFWAPARRIEGNDFSFRYENEKSIKLIPDKKSYRAGETAHVLAALPTEGAHLLVTTELMSVMSARQIDAPGRTVMIDVPIEARFAPNVYLNVAYVKDNDLYSEEQLLAVPARDKYLDVEIIPNKQEFKPRETASYTILARNADGSPAANAEVSLGVVDEAIYSIAPENAGSIRREFYGRRYNEVQTRLAGAFAFTGYSGAQSVNLTQNKPSYQLADFKNDSEVAEPIVRRLFKDTAFWQPDVLTNEQGKAIVKVELPDNLTTWRATARAVTADTRVGSAVQKVVSRKDVIMRLAMPRFLTEGDTAIISGVVHNFLKTKKTTRIKLEVTGARLLDAAFETVTIPAGGQHRVNWRVAATEAGELRLLARALTDTESDAVEMTMEIVPHGLRQTMGGTTTISDDEADKTIALDLPAHPDTQARKLRIEASPSVAATLFGALDYLTGFPYGCTEQTMSRFLPDVIVAQTLQAVPAAKIRATNDLDEKVKRGLDRLYSFQHEDGGWGWWKSDATDAFMTAYVVDGLTLAARAGYAVDEERLAAARERLKTMLDDNSNQPDAETRAYMSYALIQSGDTEAKYIEDFYANRNTLQSYGRALLALALKERGDGRANEVAAEIAAAASVNEFEAHWETRFKTHYGYEQAMDIEATAFSLKALAQITPQSELTAKAARWLVGNRRHGYYWLSTRETAFAIYGLTEYLKVSRELDPDYMLEVYVNDEQVISRRVTAEDAQSAQTFIIERKGRAVGAASRVRVVKRGRGALYLSTTLEYFTGDEEVAAQGSPALKLTREYLRLFVTETDDGKPSWRLEPLAGDVRSGDLIVSRLRLAGARAQYLMIEDPIPAGCVQVTSVSGLSFNFGTANWSDWYSAREFRDARTVFFMDNFDGDAMFQYAMRVETPGVFRVAPARVELMYQPTVQANTGNMRLGILDSK